ncbi:MAG: hypothetical protein QM650_06800 [Microlunatus sp.]
MAVENTETLAFVGPADPGHGYPIWFEDANGVRLELGLGPDPLLPAIEEPAPTNVVPGMPFPATFPAESFYFLTESRMPIGGAGTIGRARLVLGLEAAFGTPQPDPRSRVVFARIRVRIDDVVPGEFYTVTHPYGVTDPLPADDRGRVFVTDDRGVADNNFEAVRANGQVAPFLRWTAGTPAGYLGDGATARPVTGSPFGTDFFRVDGPGVANVAGAQRDPADPFNQNRVQSALFTVQGKIAARIGAEITSAHYRRAGGSVVIDLHARSAPGQLLELGGAGISRTMLRGSGRDYSVRAAAHAPAGVAPGTVSVVNTSDTPSTVTSTRVTDRVTATAVHSPADQTLTITAISSDDTEPGLTALGYGPLTGPTTFTGVAATPATIVVKSAAGGSCLAEVTIDGPVLPALPLVADAGTDLDLSFGDEVRLNGSGSRSDIVAFTWTQTAGAAATIADPAAASTAVTVTAPGDYRFSLTVTDSQGATATDEVAVTVRPVTPDTIVVTQAEFRTARDEFRISGTQTGLRPAVLTARFRGAVLGTSPVDATGAWSIRRTLTPAENALQPGVGEVIEVLSSRGGAVVQSLRIRN